MYNFMLLAVLLYMAVITALLLGFKMNRNGLKKFRTAVWILFALSHVIIPIVYFSGASDEPAVMTKDSLAIMAWGLLGILPVLGVSCLSLVFTVAFWKDLDAETRTDGLLHPGFVVLAAIVSVFIWGVIFWVIEGQPMRLL
ncbi:MAG: hypothetical protein QGG42_07180 [Phycisphaerae bacterium]|jgi:hypothetical protein|nr:hypothetical protein [Phycisphaerae bacterium]